MVITDYLKTSAGTMISNATNNKWFGASKTLALGCLLFVALPHCDAQNLVPNPSFELYDQCPTTLGFISTDRPTGWFGWTESPDYFNGCAGPQGGLDTSLGVPFNTVAFQQAWSGQAYIGLYGVFLPYEYREHAGAQLMEPMIVGETYKISFRVNLATGGSNYEFDGAGCNKIGALFTMESNAWYADPPALPGPPMAFRDFAHVYSTDVILDTVGWTLVSGSMVADSAYEYIVLGNFFHDSLTTVVPGALGYETTYYLIDSVSVICQSSGCFHTGIGVDQVADISNSYDYSSRTIVIAGECGEMYSVFDAVGRQVEVGRTRSTTEYISTEGWRDGVYILRTEAGSWLKVVVQK